MVAYEKLAEAKCITARRATDRNYDRRVACQMAVGIACADPEVTVCLPIETTGIKPVLMFVTKLTFAGTMTPAWGSDGFSLSLDKADRFTENLLNVNLLVSENSCSGNSPAG